MKNGLVDFTEFLNERQSKTIRALADKFGAVVYCRGEYQIDTSAASQIAEILNSHIFNGKVEKIPLLVLSATDIDKDRMSDSLEHESIANLNFYALFSCLCDFEINGQYVDDLSEYEGEFDRQQFKDVKVRSKFQKIYLNSDQLSHLNFIFNVNALCHEMIHKYSHDFGSFQHMLKVESCYKTKFNSHTDPMFMQMKQKAMKEHLKIIDDDEGLDYQKLNDEAYDFMIFNEDMLDGKEKLKAIKTEDGDWVVDMTQFGKIGDGRVVSKRYIEYCDIFK